PYHLQILAVSNPDGDGRRLLVIAEPPPAVTLQDIKSVDASALMSLDVVRYRIGFDGWVQDALVELPPMPETALSELVAKLHMRLFGTAYKAFAARIDAPDPPRVPARTLDLRVRAAALKKWLVRDSAFPFDPGWFVPSLVVALVLAGLRLRRS